MMVVLSLSMVIRGGDLLHAAELLLVILPGLLGLALLRDPNTGGLIRLVPANLAWSDAGQAQGLHGYDEVLPLMLARYCGPVLPYSAE